MGIGAKAGELFWRISIANEAFAKGAKVVDQSIDSLQKRMEGAGVGFAIGMAAIGAAIAGTVHAALEADKAESQLRSALAATGQEADANTERIKALANQLQRTTVYENDSIVALAAEATQLGVTADKLDGAITASIGLAAALKINLSTALRASLQAGEGNFMMLSRMVPALRAAKTDSEKLAIVQKLTASGFKQATIEVNSFWGAIAQLKNETGDLVEAIGGAFLPAIRSIGMVLSKDIIPPMKEFIEQHKQLSSLLATITGGTVALTTALWGMSKAWKFLKEAGSMAMLLRPFMLIGAKIVAIAAALFGFGYFIGTAIKEFMAGGDGFTSIGQSAEDAAEQIDTAADAVREFRNQLSGLTGFKFGESFRLEAPSGNPELDKIEDKIKALNHYRAIQNDIWAAEKARIPEADSAKEQERQAQRNQDLRRYIDANRQLTELEDQRTALLQKREMDNILASRLRSIKGREDYYEAEKQATQSDLQNKLDATNKYYDDLLIKNSIYGKEVEIADIEAARRRAILADVTAAMPEQPAEPVRRFAFAGMEELWRNIQTAINPSEKDKRESMRDRLMKEGNQYAKLTTKGIEKLAEQLGVLPKELAAELGNAP